jgi:hypothetical protein
MKYEITKKYLTCKTKRRSGIKMPTVKFIVAHDTGNKGSTALNNVTYYENSNNSESASAHLFVDDKFIYECIPALSGTPEKAWHVLYNKTKDNELYGCDANDAAIGVEYCYGSKINSAEAYKRYIWVMAYICYKFNLDPKKSITAHFILDPERKSDPKSGLADSGRTYEQLLKDIVLEYEECHKVETPAPPVSDIPAKIIFTVDNNVVDGFMRNGSNYIPASTLQEKLGDVLSWNNIAKELRVNGILANTIMKDNVNYVSAQFVISLGHKVTPDTVNKKLYIS